MITILLKQIIDLLKGWISSFTQYASDVLEKLGLIEEDTSYLPDIKSNTDDIKDNTAAVITPINNIKSNTDAINTSSATTASNTTAIMNQAVTIGTNSGRAAAFAEDCANNTLDIKDKVVTIASDTTQIRADHVTLQSDLDKIYNAIKWSCLDIETTETESGASPISFNTDIADDLISCKVGLVATQSGSGDPSPDNVRPINGYSNMGLTVNGSTITIALGDTYYSGYLDVITGNLIIDWIKFDLSSINYTITSSGLFASTAISGSIIPQNNSLVASSHIKSSIFNSVSFNSISGPGGSNPSPNGAMAENTTGGLYFNLTSVTTVSDFKTAVAGIDFIYELKTPITVSLTAQQITAIKGVNTIATDTNGNIEVTYKESVKHYLDKHDN